MAKKTATNKSRRPSITALRKALSKGGYREKEMAKGKNLKIFSEGASMDGGKIWRVEASDLDTTVTVVVGDKYRKDFTVIG